MLLDAAARRNFAEVYGARRTQVHNRNHVDLAHDALPPRAAFSSCVDTYAHHSALVGDIQRKDEGVFLEVAFGARTIHDD